MVNRFTSEVVRQHRQVQLYMYCKDLMDIGEEVGTAVFALHLPGLLLLAFYHELDGFGSVALIDMIDGFHEVLTFGTVGDRIEEVGLEVADIDDIAQDDTRLLVMDAGDEEVFQEGKGG